MKNNKIIRRADNTNHNNSAYFSNNIKKDNDILNDVDNFNFINKEYNNIILQMIKNKNNNYMKININPKLFSMSNGTGKLNETETELSSEERYKNKNKIITSKEHLSKVKKNLKNDEKNVQYFKGNVIDLKYISLKNYEQTVNILVNELKRKGVKFIKINNNSYKCTKGIRQFNVDIVKIPKNIFYYRFYNKKNQK